MGLSGGLAANGGVSVSVGELPASVAIVSSANTFTAEQTVPDLKATGLTGATAASRYVGATASGAPASGTFAVGDFVIDQTGIIWICTTAGTPGSWTAVQPNVELGYAQITSAATTTSTTYADVTGLTTTVTVGARPIKIIFDTSELWNNTAGVSTSIQIVEDSTPVAIAIQFIPGGAFDGVAVHREVRRTPSAGSHTYKVQMKVGSASTGQINADAGPNGPAFIQVVQL